jgi:hypothetical protein
MDFLGVKPTQSLLGPTHPQESLSVSQRGDKLNHYHPLIVEGMGAYDQRDPLDVAQQVCRQLARHWVHQPPTKPLMLLTQGDPLSAKGIAAITPLVAEHFGIPRGLIYLDEHIADYHWRDADHTNVTLALPYSAMARHLESSQHGIVARIASLIDRHIAEKNMTRSALEKPPLPAYFRDFALLQEVTKAACSHRCGEITIVHTTDNIAEFSVTGFYTVGLALGLVDPADLVPFGDAVTEPRQSSDAGLE